MTVRVDGMDRVSLSVRRFVGVLVAGVLFVAVGATAANAYPRPSDGAPPAATESHLVIRAQGETCYTVTVDGVTSTRTVDGQGFQLRQFTGQREAILLEAC